MHVNATPWRLRGPLVCMLVSLVLVGFAVPFVRVVAHQLGEILPDLGGYLWKDPARGAAYRIMRDRQIYAVRLACLSVDSKDSERPDLKRFRQADQDNGLYSYLELLEALRQSDTDGSTLQDRIRSLQNAPKPKLYLTRQYRLAREVFDEAGLPARRAARAAEEIRALMPYLQTPELREAHGPILCELTRRLLEMGNTWRESGQADDALAAHSAIVRLWTDLVEESPTPDVMLLAAQQLPDALRALASDTDVRGLDKPVAENGLTLQQRADQVASLHARWHELADTEGMNVLPFTGGSFHVLLAPRQHQAVLSSLGVSLFLMATWLVLFVLCLFWLIVAIITHGSVNPGLLWRHRRRGPILSAVIVCMPAAVWAAVMWAGRLDFIWLISLPTFSAIFLSPALIPVMVGLSARFQLVCHPQLVWSKAGRWIAVAVLALTAVLGPMLFATQDTVGAPPESIQTFRSAASFLGFEAVIILVLWMVMAMVRLKCGKFSLRIWSRIYLNVASRALMLVSILLLASLVANHRLDISHSRAFAKAASDPLSDRMGEQWYETYFTGARELATQIATRPES